MVSLEYGSYQHVCLHVDIIGEPFEIEDISRRLAFLRDPWGNMIELSETLPGAGA
jgi:hypothetical protein